MRLFFALLRRKGMPNGNIYTGKHRLVKPVTWKNKQALINSFQIEEENMFYLRHPYLTQEQSHGHAKELGTAQKRMDRIIQQPKEFRDHVTIESRLGHLRFQEPWD